MNTVYGFYWPSPSILDTFLEGVGHQRMIRHASEQFLRLDELDLEEISVAAGTHG